MSTLVAEVAADNDQGKRQPRRLPPFEEELADHQPA